MSLQRKVPSSVAEIADYIGQLRRGQEYISSIELSRENARLEIRFNRGPGLIPYPDTYVPIQKERLDDAAPLVERLLSGASRGAAPSKEDIQAFFEVVERA
jgi:hypothetical protein